MSRSSGLDCRRGWFAMGIHQPKTFENTGTLWRSAVCLGASYTFSISARFRRQASDTVNSWRKLPHHEYGSIDDFFGTRPHEARIVAVELDASACPIEKYQHPRTAIYLLGAEDRGLPPEVLNRCDERIILPGIYCLNVSVAGSIVMYDRIIKAHRIAPVEPYGQAPDGAPTGGFSPFGLPVGTIA